MDKIPAYVVQVRSVYADVVCDYCHKKNSKGKSLSLGEVVAQTLCVQCWKVTKLFLVQLLIPIIYPDKR